MQWSKIYGNTWGRNCPPTYLQLPIWDQFLKLFFCQSGESWKILASSKWYIRKGKGHLKLCTRNQSSVWPWHLEFFSPKDQKEPEKGRTSFLWTVNFLHSLTASELFILTPDAIGCTQMVQWVGNWSGCEDPRACNSLFMSVVPLDWAPFGSGTLINASLDHYHPAHCLAHRSHPL